MALDSQVTGDSIDESDPAAFEVRETVPAYLSIQTARPPASRLPGCRAGDRRDSSKALPLRVLPLSNETLCFLFK
jgi:hypothetical protein